MEHAVTLLVEEGHVDADRVSCAAPVIPKNLLRLHKRLGSKKGSRQKVTR